jgi:hypothetical protein
MPLQQGSSRQSVVANIRELMHSFKRSGKIGTSKPASNKKANKQAVAIALDQQRRSLAAGG